MKCLICNCDISESIKQFGNEKYPMCLSCWLSDYDWVYWDAEIIDMLISGKDIEEACKEVRYRHEQDMLNQINQVQAELL